MPARNRATGNSLRRTADEIARLAIVTEDDARAAGAFWRRQAPKKFKRLLDAKQDNEGSRRLESK